MLTDNSWPSLVRRLWEPEVKDAFARLSAREVLVGQLFFGVRRSHQGAIGLYSEVYRHPRRHSVRLATLAYQQDYDGVVPLFRGCRSEQRPQDDGPVTVEMEGLALGYGHYRARMTVRVAGGETTSIEASASVEKTAGAPGPDIPPVRWSDRTRNLVGDGKSLAPGHAFCPNCFGIGSQRTMSIPKADFESGLKGKDLYDSNRVNGRVGCPVCGGADGDYEPWYLEEHPELKSDKLRSGSGLIRMKSLT